MPYQEICLGGLTADLQRGEKAMPNPNTIIQSIKKIVPQEVVEKFDF